MPTSWSHISSGSAATDLNCPPCSPAREHVKEIAWAVLLIDVIILLIGVAVSVKTSATAMWFFGGIAALATAFIGGLLGLNLLGVWLYGRWERRHSGRTPPA
jgi:hypothetical protein